MSVSVGFAVNTATVTEIAEHLSRCDASFIPPLSDRVEIEEYARRIGLRAERFEAWAGGILVGLVAVYLSDEDRRCAFVTNVSVDRGHQRLGIASTLVAMCIEHAARDGLEKIELEVDGENIAALDLYARIGFIESQVRGRTLVMQMDTGREGRKADGRNYNAELQDTATHRYAYDFDLDVMHGYMIR